MKVAISEDQKRFVIYFVTDGEYDLSATCAATGVRASTAMQWFRQPAFQTAVKQAQSAKLTVRGYGALMTMEDTLAIAHSDISQVQHGDDGLRALPRHIRVAIKTVEFGVGIRADGSEFIYPKKVVMHDKAWALQQAAEWFTVAETVKNGGIAADDSAKRVAGLVVRPPITKDEADGEELLK